MSDQQDMPVTNNPYPQQININEGKRPSIMLRAIMGGVSVPGAIGTHGRRPSNAQGLGLPSSGFGIRPDEGASGDQTKSNEDQFNTKENQAETQKEDPPMNSVQQRVAAMKAAQQKEEQQGQNSVQQKIAAQNLLAKTAQPRVELPKPGTIIAPSENPSVESQAIPSVQQRLKMMQQEKQQQQQAPVVSNTQPKPTSNIQDKIKMMQSAPLGGMLMQPKPPGKVAMPFRQVQEEDVPQPVTSNSKVVQESQTGKVNMDFLSQLSSKIGQGAMIPGMKPGTGVSAYLQPRQSVKPIVDKPVQAGEVEYSAPIQSKADIQKNLAAVMMRSMGGQPHLLKKPANQQEPEQDLIERPLMKPKGHRTINDQFDDLQ